MLIVGHCAQSSTKYATIMIQENYADLRSLDFFKALVFLATKYVTLPSNDTSQTSFSSFLLCSAHVALNDTRLSMPMGGWSWTRDASDLQKEGKKKRDSNTRNRLRYNLADPASDPNLEERSAGESLSTFILSVLR